MPKKISTWIIIFSFQVLFFALIYWFCWLTHPDYYIVNQEINLKPLEELQILWNMDFSEDFSSKKQYSEIESLNSLQSVSEKMKNDVIKLLNEKSDLENKLNTLNNEIKPVLEELELSEQKNFNTYHDQIMQPYFDEKKAIEDEIIRANSIVDVSTDSQNKYLALQDLSKLIRRQGQNNVDIAKMEYDLSSERISQREKFLDKEVLSRLNTISNQIDQAEKRRGEIIDNLYKKKGEIYNEWINENIKRTSRLGFLDFLYFSMSVSIANTFGDILPNHILIRSIVFIQFLICLLLLGLIINFMITRITLQIRRE